MPECLLIPPPSSGRSEWALPQPDGLLLSCLAAEPWSRGVACPDDGGGCLLESTPDPGLGSCFYTRIRPRMAGYVLLPGGDVACGLSATLHTARSITVVAMGALPVPSLPMPGHLFSMVRRARCLSATIGLFPCLVNPSLTVMTSRGQARPTWRCTRLRSTTTPSSARRANATRVVAGRGPPLGCHHYPLSSPPSSPLAWLMRRASAARLFSHPCLLARWVVQVLRKLWHVPVVNLVCTLRPCACSHAHTYMPRLEP